MRPLPGVQGAILALILVACAPVDEIHDAPAPAMVEPIPGTDRHLIRLTERAAARLAIQTATAERASSTVDLGDRLAIPYSALFYDSDGATWVYTNPEPLVFVREPVTVDSVVDDVALIAGGEPGMTVVSVGATELYGAESGLGAGDH
ncbi:MAG: hypothetical protein H0U86_03735 [Chloroflexi bacterium]|nr:hypothetical protein [Chloroflexota bacterium]